MLAAIRSCPEVVVWNPDRSIITVVIDDRKHQPHHLADMIASVEQQLGRQVRH